MADQDILRITEIIKAALPYIGNSNKVMAELFVKAFDMIGSLNSVNSNKNVAACGFTASNIDLEGLLNGIRPVCNNKERAIIDRILGFFNMKRMFEMYNNIMETMKNMPDFGGFSFGDSDGTDDTENVTGNFSGANFESIFETFKNFTGSNFSSASTGFSEESTSESDTRKDSTSETKQENAPQSNNNNGFRGNDMMFELLKTMVPPEQASTFENLSMLLNSMSYDSNSKPDNKENDNG